MPKLPSDNGGFHHPFYHHHHHYTNHQHHQLQLNYHQNVATNGFGHPFNGCNHFQSPLEIQVNSQILTDFINCQYCWLKVSNPVNNNGSGPFGGPFQGHNHQSNQFTPDGGHQNGCSTGGSSGSGGQNLVALRQMYKIEMDDSQTAEVTSNQCGLLLTSQEDQQPVSAISLTASTTSGLFSSHMGIFFWINFSEFILCLYHENCSRIFSVQIFPEAVNNGYVSDESDSPISSSKSSDAIFSTGLHFTGFLLYIFQASKPNPSIQMKLLVQQRMVIFIFNVYENFPQWIDRQLFFLIFITQIKSRQLVVIMVLISTQRF